MDLALAVALGGDCLADITLLRSEPAVFGPVASDPTVSRLIDTLATSGEKALTAIRAARSEVRRRVWELAGNRAPDTGGQVTVDLDGVRVVAHSDKQDAVPTWKKSYGHHPLMGFVDHGPGGTGEPVAALLRPGNEDGAVDVSVSLSGSCASSVRRCVAPPSWLSVTDRGLTYSVAAPMLVGGGGGRGCGRASWAEWSSSGVDGGGDGGAGGRC